MKIGIVNHYFFYGSCQALYDFLKKNKKIEVIYIEFPLDISKEHKKSKTNIFDNIKKIKEYSLHTNSFFLNYIIDIFSNIFFHIKYFKSFDIVISSNPLNCFISLLLKKIIKLDKVIYFSIDYSNNRFNRNKILNYIYNKLDKFCYKKSDENWDISTEMLKNRIKDHKFNNIKMYYDKMKYTPVGVWKTRKKTYFHKNVLKLIFVGHLIERGGVFDLLKYLNKTNETQFEINILGGGDNYKNLKEIVSKHKHSKRIFLKGWVGPDEMRNYISDADFGLALYQNCNHNKNCFPTKIIEYITQSTPVITTNYNFLSKKIIEKEIGFKANNQFEFNTLISNLIKKKEKILPNLIKNTYAYSENFEWEKIFKKTLNM